MTAVDGAFDLWDEAPACGLFCSSSRLAVLDHFRVPYEHDPELGDGQLEQLRSREGGPALFWKQDLNGPVTATTLLGADHVPAIPLFTRLLSDEMLEPVLHHCGGTWERVRSIRTAGATPVASIWRREDGSVCLPFDPNEVVESFWTERYLRTALGPCTIGLRRRSMKGCYRVRPLLPRPVQIWLRRRFARLQARSVFPRWPIETCLHDFFELMLAVLTGISGEPVPLYRAVA